MLRPFGVFGVIGPFNFPVALVTGMSAGALVAGNTVVVKPSEQTPLSGALVGEAFAAAGLPDGVVVARARRPGDRPRARRGRDRRRRVHRLGRGRAGARPALPGGPLRAPGDHRDGRQEPGDRDRQRRPRRGRGRHRRVRVRLLGPEVQRLLARDRARLRARRAGRAAGGARRRAGRRRPGRPRRVHRPGDRRARGRALRRRRARRPPATAPSRPAAGSSTCRATSSRPPSSRTCRPATG